MKDAARFTMSHRFTCIISSFCGILLLLAFTSCTDYATQADIDGLKNDIQQIENEVDNLSDRIDTLKSKGYSQFYVIEGSLYSYNRDSVGTTSKTYFWRITTPAYSDSAIIQTWVRQNNGYLWSEPTWYLYDSRDVRIIDDEEVDHGYEYQILIAYKKSYSRYL